MTNKEQLEQIAQARELCEKRVGEYQVTLDSFQEKSGAGYEWTLITHNAWTTHLAEMDEIEAKIVEMDKAFTDTYLKKDLGNIYREQLLTKAKRLLGVE